MYAAGSKGQMQVQPKISDLVELLKDCLRGGASTRKDKKEADAKEREAFASKAL